MVRLQSRGHKLKPSTRIKIRLPEKRADSFYNSPEWRALMDQIIADRFGSRANARCEDPLCKQPHRIGIRIFGDHIVERRDGGADLDASNIMLRCGSCHTRKTNEHRRLRV